MHTNLIMATKTDFSTNTVQDLEKLVATKREELRALRFSVAGSKNRNVKAAATLRKEIARVLTALNAKQ